MSSTNVFKLIFRIALIAALFTMLGFALGGFLGIVSVSVLRALHMPLSIMDALWFGGVPGGVVGCLAGAVIMVRLERRRPPTGFADPQNE